MGTQDIERRIRALENKKNADSPIVAGCVRFGTTDAEIEQAMNEFKSLPKNTPKILIQEFDASMPREKK
jgi:hypothetical protein